MHKIRFGIVALCALAVLAMAFPAFVAASAALPIEQSNVLAAQPTATSVASFAPAKKTIWQANPELDQQTGNCTGTPINYCAQLVLLTPRGRGFNWKGQELNPYYLFRLKPNLYTYSGLNSLRDGKLKLTLEFTSPTTFRATQILTMKNQPGCTHTMIFNGVFLR